ncbi:MAG: TonB-dependent receptor [Kofleriaceae bacterium]|nr:TonB-dependent receptor [Kofleriaceae bacterium]
MRTFSFIVLVGTAGVVAAQPASTLTVQVLGVDGQPLGGATVLLTGPDGAERELPVDGAGSLRVTELAPGTYTAILLADGVEPVVETVEIGARPVKVVLRATAVATAETIEIEDTRIERPRDPTKYSLSRDELRVSAGTNGDALLALQNLPGVTRPPVQSSGLVVRGSAPDDTAIFVDGTQIPLAYHFGGVNSVIPVEALERLDFVPGNFGPQYGRALSAVVDLGLRSPRSDRFHGVAQLDAVDGRVFVEAPLGKRLRMMAGARRSWLDAWIGPVLEDAGLGVATAPVYADAQGVLEADLTSDTKARLAFFGSRDRLALVVDAPMASDPVGGQLGIGASFWRLQGRLATNRGPFRWTTTASLGNERRDIRVGGNFVSIDVGVVQARSEVDYQVTPTLAAVAGVDLDRQTGDIDLRIPPMTDAPTATFGRPPIQFSTVSSIFSPAAYAGLEWVPRPGLEVYPSVRVDYTTAGGDTRVQPRVTGRLRRGAVSVKAGVGLYAQPPAPGQAQDGFGNPALRNPTALQVGSGLERMFGDSGTVSVEWFAKRLTDLPVEIPAVGTSVSQRMIENTGTGYAYGLELLLKGRLGERTSGSLAYTYARSKRRDRDSDPMQAFTLDQPHTLTMLGATKVGRAWTLSGRFRFTSGQPVTPYVGGIVDLDAGAYGAVPGAEASQRLPAFHQLDLRVERQLAARVSAYLDVQNAYNRQNPVAQQYNYRYTEAGAVSGLPILPILGVRGEL